jgi:hypothetical protein
MLFELCKKESQTIGVLRSNDSSEGGQFFVEDKQVRRRKTRKLARIATKMPPIFWIFSQDECVAFEILSENFSWSK